MKAQLKKWLTGMSVAALATTSTAVAVAQTSSSEPSPHENISLQDRE